MIMSAQGCARSSDSQRRSNGHIRTTATCMRREPWHSTVRPEGRIGRRALSWITSIQASSDRAIW
jgi:hypothetical protein